MIPDVRLPDTGEDDDASRRVLNVRLGLRKKNDELAATNRERFRAAGVRVANVVSAPGSGKTALLERTIFERSGRRVGVLVGDLATENDANRIRGAGGRAVQIVTGTVCHLDAAMVARAADDIGVDDLDWLFVENVGNLVCPAGYDLGEDLRIVLFSATEGEDKPLKYPTIFQSAQWAVLSKIDLAAATGFDRNAARENLRRISPRARIFELSAKSGEGMTEWLEALEGFFDVQRQ